MTSIQAQPRGLALALATAGALALSAGGASASNILATGDNLLGGTTTAAEPNLAGVVVEDMNTPVSFALNGGVFSADVQSRVVLSVDGTYDFYWRVHDTSFTAAANNPLTDNADASGPLAALTAFRLGNFGIGVAGLNGNYATDGLGDQGPDDAYVFSGGIYDQYVNFVFGPSGLAAGQGSYFMFLDTNAHSYAMNASFDLAADNYQQNSDVFRTFGVAGAPEPAEWSLMIAGFGLAGASLRARRRLASA